MNILSASVVRIVVLCSLVALASIAELPVRADLTGQQILAKCQNAYRTLKTYSGKTTVQSGGSVDSTSATVQYARPGKIRVDGTFTGSGNFTFISDGSHTWEKSSLSGGKWTNAESTEMAIAGFTGVSGMAVTTIPAILTGSSWGNPFLVTPSKVMSDTIAGRAAYRLDCTNPLGTITFWIDKQTFLLVKTYSIQNVPEFDPTQTPGTPPVPKANGKTTRMETTETFTNVRINESIAASAFVQPKGAP